MKPLHVDLSNKIHILPKNQKFRFLIEINYEFYSKQNIFVPRLDSTLLVTQTNEFNQQIKPTSILCVI